MRSKARIRQSKLEVLRDATKGDKRVTKSIAAVQATVSKPTAG